MTHLFVIVKLFRNNLCIDINLNEYLSLEEALKGNLCEGDVLINLFLESEEKDTFEENTITHYYIAYIK